MRTELDALCEGMSAADTCTTFPIIGLAVEVDQGDGSSWLSSFRVRAVCKDHSRPSVLADDRAITRHTVR